MASNIQAMRTAIRDILMATTVFKTGIAYARPEIGVKPGFMVWYDGWSTPDEPDVQASPRLVTHRFQIDIHVDLSSNSNAETDQNKFHEVLEAAVDALQANPRLSGTCLRSRVQSGATDIDGSAGSMKLVGVLMLDADRMNW